MKTSLTRFFEEVFCESLLQDFFENVMQNNSLPKENQQSQLNGNWSEKMKDLKGLLKTPIEIEAIDFTEQNVKNLGESIIIPESVTSIGIYALSNCTSLKTIRYTGTEEQWDFISKDYDWNKKVPSDCQFVFNYVG